VVDGTGEKKEANGELDKSDCNGHNKTDETVALGAKKASGGSRIVAFFGKMFKPRSDVVADKSATEDQTVVKMVNEEGLEQTVVEETTPLAKELDLEVYIYLLFYQKYFRNNKEIYLYEGMLFNIQSFVIILFEVVACETTLLHCM
jgi:hypothetical protein